MNDKLKRATKSCHHGKGGYEKNMRSLIDYD